MKSCFATLGIVIALCAPAWGQGLGNFGIRAGVGLGLTTPAENLKLGLESSMAAPIAVGPAWHLELPITSFEVDLLYRRYGQGFVEGAEGLFEHRLALPMMFKVEIPGLQDVQAGIGIEPRLLLAMDDENDASYEKLVWYAPVSLGGTASLPFMEIDIEARLEFQISNHYIGPQADDSRMHQLMFYVGGFF